ncbi:MAG: helix-turn-helix transcriptional regulator [Coriobacteriia bacterium]|nr:helix-turn-helix transcriptional regulator [Coriobacteriia bacterium]MBS5478303.1 helix-turn-helix transcriptional regulator [Coriobacteriia bacterium]
MGHSYAYIAGALGISENTVRAHVRNMYRKVGVTLARSHSPASTKNRQASLSGCLPSSFGPAAACRARLQGSLRTKPGARRPGIGPVYGPRPQRGPSLFPTATPRASALTLPQVNAPQ